MTVVDSKRRAEIRYHRREGYQDCYNGPFPRLRFPAEFEIEILPPFAGALFRFRVWAGETWVSVYCDDIDAFGSMGRPYYEIYPDERDDTRRFWPDETEAMMIAIIQSLSKRKT